MRPLSLVLLVLALIVAQALIGGVRIVFSAPAYALLAVAGLSLVAVRKAAALPRFSCLVPTLALAVWVFGRSLFSPVDYLARNDLLMVIAALLVYLATAIWFTDAKTRLTVVGVLLLGALIHAVVGAVQFKQNDNFMLLPGIMRPSYGWRASGFYICPNHLAGLLEAVGLLGLSLAWWSAGRAWLRVIAGYGALMCLAGLAITGSRGGYLSVLLGLGVFAVLSLWVTYRLRRGGFWLMLGGLAVGAMVIVGGALFFMSRSESLQGRLGQIYDPSNMRLLMWQAALTQHQLQPWIGTGSGTYLYYGRQFRSHLVQNDPMHVHNDYLELLAEYGLIGAVLGGAFLLLHARSGLLGLRKMAVEQLRPDIPAVNSELALVIGALSGIAALLLHSVVDFNMHIPANALVVAFLFGILARPDNAAPGTLTPRLAWLRWSAPAVGVLLLALCIRFFPGEYFTEKARVALRDQRYLDALGFAQRALTYERKNPNTYAHLGDAKHFLTENLPDASVSSALHEEAVAAYREGLQLYPRDTGLLLKLARSLSLLERFPEADEVFQRVFECDPNFGLAYAYYGLHWQLQRRMKMAERYFRRAYLLGETDISVSGLRRIDQMRKSPVGQTLLSLEPDVPLPPENPAPQQ